MRLKTAALTITLLTTLSLPQISFAQDINSERSPINSYQTSKDYSINIMSNPNFQIGPVSNDEMHQIVQTPTFGPINPTNSLIPMVLGILLLSGIAALPYILSLVNREYIYPGQYYGTQISYHELTGRRKTRNLKRSSKKRR